VLMIGLTLFVERTKLGKAMRATAQDRDAAELMGIDINRTIAATFFIGALLAGAGGMIFGLYYNTITFDQGFTAGLVRAGALALDGVRLDVVVGPWFAGVAELRALAGGSGGAIVVHEQPRDMRALMLAAGLAISGGGQTTFELAATGTPTVAIRLADNQTLTLETLAEAGALIQAGALVNDTSIVRETKVPERFTYYHVELADHSLIVAENTPAETFIDNIDRMAFDNWDEHDALPDAGDMQLVEMGYARAKACRQVPRATRDRMARRAAALNGRSQVA